MLLTAPGLDPTTGDLLAGSPMKPTHGVFVRPFLPG